ncbi:urease accessory protein UreD [Curvibacter sp. CHRR-16]|uniref:urease accessory protein UreD n=1 Tax=Curvibacter sp. CHRR-16 TaxID=2835872 RepID=UPI001BD9EFCD|nr:urease accessory protein UreD [Curvibacter sp. CHRR-16]MBT0568992.1 urease accessory protein UreD [Curvibacter sp. CHRR-16]
MTWHARLSLHYQQDRSALRTLARFSHDGPLRILQSLYPEGDAICHNVLVHPPGGLVGGDTLDIAVQLDSGTHGLITTPGASRFYRSDGPLATQRTVLQVAADARLEWLPLEAICFDGCNALNHLELQIAPGGCVLGWDVTALGLPHAQQPFVRGSLQQHLELPGVWLERGRIQADDALLMNAPAGLAGQRCLATLFWAQGSDIGRDQREQLLDSARTAIDVARGATAAPTTAPQTPLHAGATAVHPQVVVVRVLTPTVEPAMQLLRQIRRQWRAQHWGCAAQDPRIWAM